jgi:hypothetical protein
MEEIKGEIRKDTFYCRKMSRLNNYYYFKIYVIFCYYSTQSYFAECRSTGRFSMAPRTQQNDIQPNATHHRNKKCDTKYNDIQPIDTRYRVLC